MGRSQIMLKIPASQFSLSSFDAAVLCVRCHEANSAKPKTFPQVASAEHSAGLPCDTCHQPHSPAITAEGQK
jgi:hypothetical protein